MNSFKYAMLKKTFDMADEHDHDVSLIVDGKFLIGSVKNSDSNFSKALLNSYKEISKELQGNHEETFLLCDVVLFDGDQKIDISEMLIFADNVSSVSLSTKE
ncbi:hypothetical protein A4A32_01710 [Staphylococcus equorum]|nr:hypothetical protein [Staphylococcus equorum]MDW4026481.1 hypothetical protein [Staphylococcus saprophyticus]MDW4083648.1 hypothetical protein [Staphylococcus saprophyticus]OIS56049.1 hypothetical protein A4A32_01710 [Staphylococcus equorum]UNP87095.1 hypothetical protein MNZ23_05700 [Staphylococcus equorum]